jgi:hypothetical protein
VNGKCEENAGKDLKNAHRAKLQSDVHQMGNLDIKRDSFCFCHSFFNNSTSVHFLKMMPKLSLMYEKQPNGGLLLYRYLIFVQQKGSLTLFS